MNNDERIIRVSVSEAGKLFGVSTKLIRDALKDQKLRYIIVRGRYKINFESLVKWSQSNRRRENKLNNDGIGQFVESWKMSAPKFSPRAPQKEK